MAMSGIGHKRSFETTADRKMRFGGILENPLISKIQRAILDGGRVSGLKSGLRSLEYLKVLDVGCGLGECSAVNKGSYVGIDNSFPRIAYAAHCYPKHTFFVADAVQIPFASKTFDLALLIDTSHHLTDEEFATVLKELKRISRRYIVVSDPVVYERQNALSKFFYKLDRGACFRTEQDSRAVFANIPGLGYKGTFSCRTFPGLYVHQAFVLEITEN